MTTAINETEMLRAAVELANGKVRDAEKRAEEAEKKLRYVGEHVVRVSDRIAQQVAAEHAERPNDDMVEHLLDCLAIAWRARWELGIMESDIQLVPETDKCRLK